MKTSEMWLWTCKFCLITLEFKRFVAKQSNLELKQLKKLFIYLFIFSIKNKIGSAGVFHRLLLRCTWRQYDFHPFQYLESLLKLVLEWRTRCCHDEYWRNSSITKIINSCSSSRIFEISHSYDRKTRKWSVTINRCFIHFETKWNKLSEMIYYGEQVHNLGSALLRAFVAFFVELSVPNDWVHNVINPPQTNRDQRIKQDTAAAV